MRTFLTFFGAEIFNMGHELIFLIIYVNLLTKGKGNTLNHGYRFNVYPVNECPMNKTTFEKAAEKMNCTGRYLCAPNIDLTHLIEFCTDQNRGLYGKGNCVRLEGTGNLNHYNCSEFDSGCPHEPYGDDEIYKYPACLNINRVLRCFVSEKGCQVVKSEEIDTRNKRSRRENVAIFITFCVLVIVVAASYLFNICWRKFFKDKNTKTNDRGQFLDTDEIDKDRLKQFLKEGHLTKCHARCIIVGCDGAGKTTLLKRLEGATLKELKKIEETKLLNVHVNNFEVVQKENTIKHIPKSNADVHQTIIFSKNEIETNELKNPPEQEQASEHKESKEEDVAERGQSSNYIEIPQNGQQNKDERNLPQSNNDESERISNDPAKTLPQTSIKRESFVKSTLEDGKRSAVERIDISETSPKGNDAMQACLNDLKFLSKSENYQITFLDFAGQSIYYAFHQIYLSPKAVYILVLDMTKSFDEKDPTIPHKDLNRFEEWTYKDYYTFWLKSVDSYSDTMSPVIVVGTHEDKLLSMEPKTFFEKLFELFEGKKDLERHINSERCFPIGFPKKGSRVDDLQKIKTCIASSVQELPCWREDINPKWALFEHLLGKKIKRKIVTREQLSEYNAELPSDFQLSEKEITEALKYLNKVGSLLYSDDDEDNIRNTVILDVQWFVDAFTCIITKTTIVNDFSDSERKQFHNTGELKDKQLEAIWKLENKEYLSYKEKIISYMENLGLVAICGSGRSDPNKENSLWYYFPSLNRKTFDKLSNTPKTFTPSSILCFQFDENGRFPVFAFYALVSKCNKIEGWEILVEDRKTCIYEKSACFSYRDVIVILCVCKFQIQVQVFTPTDYDMKSINKICVEIQASVEKEIRKFKKYDFEIGYKCQNAELFNENDDSFIGLDEFPTNRLLCRRCAIAKKHLVDDSVCWIKRSGRDNSDTQLKFDNSKEITDEGLVSLRHIFRDSLDGNIENFKFHFEKNKESRKDLLSIVTEKGWNLMHCAAKGGDLKIFEILSTEMNCKIKHEKTYKKLTVLHIAAEFGNYSICKRIVDGKDFELLNETSVHGKNACHFAAEGGHVAVLKLLFGYGADVKATNDQGQNIFHIACIYGQLEMCRYISKIDQLQDLLSAESTDGWNATLYAAKNGDTKILNFLRDSNVKFDHTSVSKRNALHVACDNANFEACRTIADMCLPLLVAVDERGRHAGHFAVRGGNMQILTYLEDKLDVTLETSEGMNILHMACLHCQYEMCRYILKHYPKLNVKSTEKEMTTAHFVAVRGNNKGHERDIFQALIKGYDKVDIKRLTKQKNSVLTLAIKYKNYEFAQYLLQYHPELLDIPGVVDPRKACNNDDIKMKNILEAFKI